MLARTVTKKIAILQGIADIVHELDVDIVVAVVPSKQIRKNHGKDRVMEHALTMILERLEMFARLREIDELRIVSDEMRDRDQEKASAILSNMSSGRSAISGMRAAHLSGIEYVSSMSSVLNQVADVVAYTINRHGGGVGGLADVFDTLSGSIRMGLVWEGRVRCGAAGPPYNRAAAPGVATGRSTLRREAPLAPYKP